MGTRSKTTAVKKKANGEAPEIDAQTAVQVLQAEADKKIQACQEEINKVLEKHGCMLDVSLLINARGNVPRVQVVLKQ